MVDAEDLKSFGSNTVWVRVPPWAPRCSQCKKPLVLVGTRGFFSWGLFLATWLSSFSC